MTSPTYDVFYFIRKFAAIPEEQWTTQWMLSKQPCQPIQLASNIKRRT